MSAPLRGLTRGGKTVLQVPCIDVYPPEDFKEADQSLVFQAISLTDSIWKPGSKGKISITFGGYACPGCSPDAAWSHIGNKSNIEYPSMNLGFIDPPFEKFTWKGIEYSATPFDQRNYCGTNNEGHYVKSKCEDKWKAGATVIHEFCHALGMLHEHQNNLENSNEIKLNEQNVIDYYQRLGMGEEGAITNVLERYGCSDKNDCKYDGTKYDKNSIMLYALPDDWVVGENPTYPNFELSENDKGWLKELYPKNIDNYPELEIEFVDPNPEPWKVAWVEKIVRETFEPLIGVKWNFNTQNILKKAAVTTTKQATSTTEEPVVILSSEWTPSEISSLVIGILFGLAALILIGFLIFKNVQAKGRRKR